MTVGATLRLYRLESPPPFVDEDRYSSVAVEMTQLAWPQSIMHPADPGVNKAPLIFVAQALLIVNQIDPLIAGRLISAAAGIVAIPLTFWLGALIGRSRTVGVFAAAFYACSPVSVLHERMVLQDTEMSTVLLGVVLVAFTAPQKHAGRSLLVAGALLALAVQTKVSGIVGVVVLTRVLLVKWHQWPLSTRCVAALTVMAGPLSYAVLLLAPTGRGLTDQNADLLRPSLAAIGTNASSLADSMLTYFPFGSWLFVPIGFYVLARREPRIGSIILWMLFAYIAVWVVISRFVATRYVLPAIPYLYALMALATVTIGSAAAARFRLLTRASSVVPLLATTILFLAATRIAFDPEHASLSALDDSQYRSSWSAGYAYVAAAEFLSANAPRATRIAYAIDRSHLIAASAFQHRSARYGLCAPIPLSSENRLALESADFVVVDDPRSGDSGTRVQALQQLVPQLLVIERYTNPLSQYSVTLLQQHRERTAEAADVDSC